MDKEERKKLAIYGTLLILVLLVAIPILASLVVGQFAGYIYLIGISITEPDEPQFDCAPMVEINEEYIPYVNETWIESDKIREYEDIPEGEKRNLSEDAKRFLRDSARVDYTPREYENLTKKEKSIFMSAIETDDTIDYETVPDREVISPEYVNLSTHDTRYNGTTYECLIIRDEDA